MGNFSIAYHKPDGKCEKLIESNEKKYLNKVVCTYIIKVYQ